MAVPRLPDIVLYERHRCHLCEETRANLEQLLAAWVAAGRQVPRLVGRDIDTYPAWHDAFFETIPVVEVGERRLPLATDPARVRRFVEEALAAYAAEGIAGQVPAEHSAPDATTGVTDGTASSPTAGSAASGPPGS
jgi:hypothetical protein